MEYNYEKPVIELLNFNQDDIVCSSPGMGDGGELGPGNGGSETPW